LGTFGHAAPVVAETPKPVVTDIADNGDVLMAELRAIEERRAMLADPARGGRAPSSGGARSGDSAGEKIGELRHLGHGPQSVDRPVIS